MTASLLSPQVDAEKFYQQALSIFEKRLGGEHHDTAYPLYGLAELYQRQEKYEQAEVLYQRAVAIREQHFGSTHPQSN